ncbi:MAG TPA: M20 family metallopeptidase [Cyclobacteriaceae bacterium]|nr:M20 family metallopeptidase [Cyclobacteriaceae bacterium]
MELSERIKSFSRQIHPEVIKLRRHLHANPELSFEEYNTAKFVAGKLREFGLSPSEGIAKTGVTCLIKGRKKSDKVIALRADMDALPIQEKNNVPYKSMNDGVMHACGHDVHTSSLLGTAWILEQLKDELEGSIKLIFQPGEEKAPGGASLMIREGVLQNPSPSFILGQHVMPQLPAGKVGFKPGLYMASADEIYLRVIGKGGHGAMPDINIDPVVIASHIIIALQQIVSRNANPKIPSVLSFGKVIANGATNVIPDEVYIEGTFRTLNEEWRASAHDKIRKIAQNVGEGMGARVIIEILHGYPYLKNDPELTMKTKDLAQRYLGPENVIDLDIWMAAEDFAFYTQHIGACFYRLGVGNEAKGITSSVHTPTFDIDENSLEIGPGLMAWLALSS